MNTCQKCGRLISKMSFRCGAWVCWDCGHHNGLVRCFCGWAADGGDGRKQLIDLGENLDEE